MYSLFTRLLPARSLQLTSFPGSFPGSFLEVEREPWERGGNRTRKSWDVLSFPVVFDMEKVREFCWFFVLLRYHVTGRNDHVDLFTAFWKPTLVCMYANFNSWKVLNRSIVAEHGSSQISLFDDYFDSPIITFSISLRIQPPFIRHRHYVRNAKKDVCDSPRGRAENRLRMGHFWPSRPDSLAPKYRLEQHILKETLDFAGKFRLVFSYETVVFRRYVLALLLVGLSHEFEAYLVYLSPRRVSVRSEAAPCCHKKT